MKIEEADVIAEQPDLGRALDWGRTRIGAMEAKLLLCEAAGVTPVQVAAHPEAAIAGAVAERYRSLVERRVAGEPVAYLLGRREFYGRSFAVGPGVLIPRPETELLVDLACCRLAPVARPSVLDLGTGSGILATTLALELVAARVTAVDRSAAALAIAHGNAERLGAKVEFLDSDWFSALEGRRFHAIVANPPYVADGDAHLSQGDLRFEPREALAAGGDGLSDLRRIIAEAQAHLLPGACLLLEHGYDQAEAVRGLLAEAGFTNLASWRDISGMERASGGSKPP